MRSLWNSSVFSTIIVSVREGDRRVKGEEDRVWRACIWDVGSEVRIKHICQMDAGHHDYVAESRNPHV